MAYALCTMHKRMTITLEESVYDGLYRVVGKRRISQFIEDLLRPHVSDQTLDEGYRAMASDIEREQGADEWLAALKNDVRDEAR
jgi:predicted CopG family antitoxin